MKKINIALCGVGNVGSSFIDLLFTSREKIKSNFDIEINLTLIGSRKGEIANNDFQGQIERDILKVPLHKDIDIVVELIGGTDISYELAKLALENNKHFVTANKALIALSLINFLASANKSSVLIKFSCGTSQSTFNVLAAFIVAGKVSAITINHPDCGSFISNFGSTVLI